MATRPTQTGPSLGEALIDRLRAHGRERAVEGGEVLWTAGASRYDFMLVLDGRIDIVDDLGGPDERIVGDCGRGEFAGELALLMHQRAFLSGVAHEPGRLLEIPGEEIDRIMFGDVALSELILRVFVARHERLRDSDAGVTVIGSRAQVATRRLVEALARNRVAARWLRPDEDGTAERLLDAAGLADAPQPVVLIPGRPSLEDPDEHELLDGLGLATARRPGTDRCDLLIVGAGPGGLSAAVYAASEGMETIVAEQTAFGGQAGTSTRIENYLGFPAGLSGEELSVRALLQMEKFGVDRRLGVAATRLECAQDEVRVHFDDDTCVAARTLVIATGARYRRLDLERLEDFESAGVYYAATRPERLACDGREVIVVGGGNSAGQAAMFLSRGCARVDIVIRGDALEASMSRYLIDEISATPSIGVTTGTEVTALYGGDRLEAVELTERATGKRRRVEIGGLFVFIGAAPCTNWLDGQLAADDDGFLLTGTRIPEDRLAPGDERPTLFRTSRPGVFCIGDARSGSVKRVAAATGEGATAVRLAFEHLQASG